MFAHQFIFKPAIWIGEGKVAFSTSLEKIHFYTKWIIEPADSNGQIGCEHQVQMQETNEKVINLPFCGKPKQHAWRALDSLVLTILSPLMMTVLTIKVLAGAIFHPGVIFKEAPLKHSKKRLSVEQAIDLWLD